MSILLMMGVMMDYCIWKKGILDIESKYILKRSGLDCLSGHLAPGINVYMYAYTYACIHAYFSCVLHFLSIHFPH